MQLHTGDDQLRQAVMFLIGLFGADDAAGLCLAVIQKARAEDEIALVCGWPTSDVPLRLRVQPPISF